MVCTVGYPEIGALGIDPKYTDGLVVGITAASKEKHRARGTVRERRQGLHSAA